MRLAPIVLAVAAAIPIAAGPSGQSRTATTAVPRAGRAPASSWIAPVNISATGSYSASPILALDGRGGFFVVWTEWLGGQARNMMFNARTGDAWGAPRVVSPLLYDAIDDVGFPTVAAGSDGSAYVAYHDGIASSMEILLWEYREGRFGPSYIDISATPDGSSAYAALAVSPVDGWAGVIWMDGTFFEYDLAVRWRDPSTGIWGPAELLPFQPRSGKYIYQVNNFVIDASGTAHLAYTTRPFGALVWYTKNRTPRDAAAWTEPALLSPASGLPWTFPKIATDDAGEAYVVWHEIVDGNEEILLRKTAGGAWQPAENLSRTATPSENPAVAVDPASGEIYVAWQELVGGANWEVLVKAYERAPGSAIAAWSETSNLSSTPGRSGEPCLRIDPQGSVHLVYHEEGAAGANAEILYARYDRGRLFPPLDPVLSAEVRPILYYREKTIRLSFEPNPANDASSLIGYRVYRKAADEPDDRFAAVADLGPEARDYIDARLPLGPRLAYALTALGPDGRESPRSRPAIETR